MWIRLLGCVLLMMPLSARAFERPAAAASDPFEKKIRPLLANHCWKCHGPQKPKGGLRLDSEEGIAKGGDTGPIIVPGKPEESLLIEAIRYQGDLKMPPKGRLSDAEVADLVAWVRAGATWPMVEKSPSPAQLSDRPTAPGEPRSFWAFQPPRDPTPPDIRAGNWPKSPLDRFILAGLERKGLTPAPSAEKRSLIRRATFDLTGLPPRPKRSTRFSKTDRPMPSRRSSIGCWRRPGTASDGGDIGSTWHAMPTPTVWTKTSPMPTRFATEIT